MLENHAHKEDVIVVFFDERQSILNPPCYNYIALKEFLDQADPGQLKTGRPILVLLDDRRDHSVGDESMRNWESDKYARQPPEGDDIKRLVFDEGGLFTKLRENV